MIAELFQHLSEIFSPYVADGEVHRAGLASYLPLGQDFEDATARLDIGSALT